MKLLELPNNNYLIINKDMIIIIMSLFIINSNWRVKEVNPLSPKNDQHQISPCNIDAL